MDMKKILQAMDGISTKPVEGVDGMSKFLRVVKEADVNPQTRAPVGQPTSPASSQGQLGAQLKKKGFPNLKPVKAPPMPTGQLQPGERLETNPDGTVSYSGATGIYVYDKAGKPIKYISPSFAGVTQTNDLVSGNISVRYQDGPQDMTVNFDKNGKPLDSKTFQYDLGPIVVGQATQNGITTNTSYERNDGSEPNQYDDITGVKDPEVYNRAMAQVNRPVNENLNSMSRFASIVKEADLNPAVAEAWYDPRTWGSAAPTAPAEPLSPDQIAYNQLRAQLDGLDALRGSGANTFTDTSPEVTASVNAMRQKLAQMAASLKAKGIDAAAEYDAPEPGVAPTVDPIDLQQRYAGDLQENSLSKFLSIVNKNNVSMLKEGANPHKVALPVQMVMQHYQTPAKQAINETSSVFKTYVALIENDIVEQRTEKQQLIRQYSQRIAEAVLMKERVTFNPDGTRTPSFADQMRANGAQPSPVSTAPAVVPLGKRFDPRFKNGPEPYTIDIDGVVYKFAGRDKTGPGTGEVIKVPAAVIGIRGLGAISVELGKDGMYYPAPATNESAPSAGLSKTKKSAIAKKAAAGKDIGKPGKSFDKVAKAAGGGEKGEKIAAAAMWKNIKR